MKTVGEGLRVLDDVRQRFESDYRRLLGSIRDRGRPAGVCTIYNPSLPDPVVQREVIAALAIFNDCIIRIAREFKCPVLELRAVCTEAADFVAQIEPSLRGGSKIAEAICRGFLAHDSALGKRMIFP